MSPPDGFNILRLAKEYGQAPQDVENWEEWWLLRAVELLDGEAIYFAAEDKRRVRDAKKR